MSKQNVYIIIKKWFSMPTDFSKNMLSPLDRTLKMSPLLLKTLKAKKLSYLVLENR